LNNYHKLKKRIKRNEGYSNILYLDQLGYATIGYGHLIKKNEKFLPKKKYSKKSLESLFQKDFNKALRDFNKHYKTKKLSNFKKEIVIEMIFQMGIKGVLKFKRFNKYIDTNKNYLAALEMKNSLWYAQTPKRVDTLVNILLGLNNDRR
tara:strand:+ start:2409 stop:2855 length:447 start_codon:yes stop_codon:yes gene_type:complete